jgi:tetratricopeptide (TPR) repeat protein
MSQPTSPPPPATGTIDVGPPSGIPPAHHARPVDPTAALLREELALATERPRKARLSYEIGEAQEKAGDEPGAAREYLAAFNADPTFREPLEGLVRLLERRRSVKNLGKLLDALVRASATPDEKARALLMRAAHQEDTVHDLEAAKNDTIDATTAGARGAETALAWLMLEVLAVKTGNASLRAEALGERAKHAGDPTWKALLLLDLGRLAAAAGEATRALSLFDQSRSLESAASFTAARAAARLIRSDPGTPGSDEAKERLRTYAVTLEAQAELIRQARASSERGDALGVPMWTRDTTHMVDAWLRAAEAHRLAGQIAAAAGVLDRALSELGNASTDSAGIVETALVNERIRVAEQMGDTALAAELSQKRIANEQDKGVAAALAMRSARWTRSRSRLRRTRRAFRRVPFSWICSPTPATAALSPGSSSPSPRSS